MCYVATLAVCLEQQSGQSISLTVAAISAQPSDASAACSSGAGVLFGNTGLVMKPAVGTAATVAYNLCFQVLVCCLATLVV